MAPFRNGFRKGSVGSSGGGRKPYRQKGTGHARQGTIRAPQFRTGGVVFGPQPRAYGGKVNKKERRLALQTALSAKRAAGELIILSDFALTEARTKPMRRLLQGLDAVRSTLIVLPVVDRIVDLASRNLPGISVVPVEGVNVYDLLAHEKLILTEAAWKGLEERLS